MKLGMFALPAAFLLAFAALIAGCGGGQNPLTLDEYFVQFEVIDTDLDAQIDQAFAGFPADVPEEEFLADEANLPLVKDVAAAFPRIVGDYLGRIEDLQAPSEVEDAHEDLLAATRELLVTFEEGADIVDEAETMAEFSALSDETNPSIQVATARFNTACRAVADIAEANGIAVDITCGDDDSVA